MSLLARGLNSYLRWTEKRHLARADDIDAMRRSFAFRARLFFHGPRGTSYVWDALGGVPVQWVCTRDVGRDAGPLILYFHGGGYVFGSTNTHRAMAARLSKEARLPVCMVEYRLAPEHPFPAAFEDGLAVYDALAAQGRSVLLGGDSAGGGLALALLGHCVAQDIPLPLASFAFSPFTDMTFSGESMRSNEEAEVMLPASRIEDISEAYLVGAEPEDPRASPLFAQFAGATPVWLTVGDTEILRDDTTRLAALMREAGLDVTEIVTRDLPHVWPIFHNILPEARATLRELAVWIRQQTG